MSIFSSYMYWKHISLLLDVWYHPNLNEKFNSRKVSSLGSNVQWCLSITVLSIAYPFTTFTWRKRLWERPIYEKPLHKCKENSYNAMHNNKVLILMVGHHGKYTLRFNVHCFPSQSSPPLKVKYPSNYFTLLFASLLLAFCVLWSLVVHHPFFSRW